MNLFRTIQKDIEGFGKINATIDAPVVPVPSLFQKVAIGFYKIQKLCYNVFLELKLFFISLVMQAFAK